MNETVAIIFINKQEPNMITIAYEQADIDFYRIDMEWLEVGSVIYDTYKKEVIRKA